MAIIAIIFTLARINQLFLSGAGRKASAVMFGA